jgi:hypothetical protein
VGKLYFRRFAPHGSVPRILSASARAKPAGYAER